MRVAQEIGSLYRQGQASILLGDALLALPDLERAEASYRRALEVLPRAERGHQALDAWAGLVRIALARKDPAAALAYTNEILARLDAQTFYDSNDPSAVYLLCTQVLEMQNDARAREILERGNAELCARAAHIRDDALRQAFLEQVSSHRALRAAHRLLHEADAGPCTVEPHRQRMVTDAPSHKMLIPTRPRPKYPPRHGVGDGAPPQN